MTETVFIVPKNAKRLNENQFMIGFNYIFKTIQFEWNEPHDIEDFTRYYNDLPEEQSFLVFKTKNEAVKYVSEHEAGIAQPGYLVNIRSRVPIYQVGLQNETQLQEISKSEVKELIAASMGLGGSLCKIDINQQQHLIKFYENINILNDLTSKQSTLNANIKKKLSALIDCIQQPKYKGLGFEEKNTIVDNTRLLLQGEMTPEDYKQEIQKNYLGNQSSPALKILGGILMALAIAVSVCILASGAPIISTLCVGAGIGLIGYGFFGMGQGSGIRKHLDEVLDASKTSPPQPAI